MNNIHHIVLSFVLILFSLNAMAQGQCEVSSLVRQLIAENPKKDGVTKAKESISKVKGNAAEETAATAAKSICCFVRVDDGCNIDEVISRLDGRCQLRMGNLCIVTLPVAGLAELSVTKGIKRIEANTTRNHITTDLTRRNIHVNEVHEGASPLPHPFRGKGTVLGIMDIGFDLTHPNFLSAEDNTLRIGALWDMLDLEGNGNENENDNDNENENDDDNGNDNENDDDNRNENDNLTLDNGVPIGREHRREGDLLAYAHSADGLMQSHGTHTLGIAAGSGMRSDNASSDYMTSYMGMAPDADICCVANATGNNAELIPKELHYIYTYALDALGFKYIFDYADQQGKPCVISFSEGSSQDLQGDDILYYEMLNAMTGPGHIIVSAAGNNGAKNTFLHKSTGDKSAGTGLMKWATEKATMGFTVDTSAPAVLHFIAYDRQGISALNDTISIPLDFTPGSEETTSPSGLINHDTVERTEHFGTEDYTVRITSNPNCYDSSRWAYYITLQAETMIGYPFDVDMVVEDIDPMAETTHGTAISTLTMPADVKIYSTTGELVANATGKRCDAVSEANIVSPASAPCVICVASNSYRTGIVNYKGETMGYNTSEEGIRSATSSVGPTMDGRTKPDVTAPGANIISSYNSYYIEQNPEAGDVAWDVEHFPYNGRTYAWNSNSGTSMACPAVAGIIALWLEACPTLTTESVLDVIAHTSRRPDPSLPYPNNLYGYGEIDAYAGLLRILQFDNIGELSRTPARNVRISCRDGVMTVHLNAASATPQRCAVWSVSGKKMMDFTIPADEKTHTVACNMPSGYYAVQIGNNGSAIIKQKH